MLGVDRPTATQRAEDALRLANVAAGRAAPVAAAAVRHAVTARDNGAASIAERAWGRALLQTGDVARAVQHLRTSIRLADRAGSAELAGESRIPLAAALVQHGRPQEAMQEIDLAVRELSGAGRARARAQRADVLHQIGRREQAQTEYLVAVPMLRRAGDLLNLERTLGNRGILHTERHAFAAAERDLLEAEQLAQQLGRELSVGIIAENLGYLETLRGNVPAALAHLARAERTISAHGGRLGEVYRDRADLLLSVGAVAEAQEAAQRAVEAFERERRRLLIPDAHLILAQAAFLARDWPTALEHARRARRDFHRQQQTEWAALARLVALRAELMSGNGTRMPDQALHEMVRTLTAASWPEAALEARLAAARCLLGRGRHDQATAMLTEAASGRLRGPAALRARAWYAQALLRDRQGDRTGTASAIRAGLRILDEHSTSLGAADLRAYAAVHRTALVDLGQRAALRERRGRRVFEWAERARASRLLDQPVLPPDDPTLAELLAELRAAARDDGPAGMRQRVALERRIRDYARLHRGSANGRSSAPVRIPALADALGERALLEFVQLDGVLHGLSLVDGRVRLRELGPLGRAIDLVDRLPFALHRITRGGNGRAQPAVQLLVDAARRLDRLLLGPFPELDGRPLVVVPTGALHSVPWSTLPQCAGRAVTVSPSATLWHAANTPARGSQVSVVAGPELAGADAEARSVAAIHAADAITGESATVSAVLAALSSSDLVHLATHGQLAADNPLFSSLRLHDGPLVVYDIHRQQRMPHTVVLAACDSARAVVCTGDELLGLSAAFIARGTSQLVASVVPIPDAATAPLMTAFHRRLADGETAPAALAHVQRDMREGNAQDLAAAAGFVCIGGG